MDIKKYIADRVGNLGEVLFGIAGIVVLILGSIILSIELSDRIGKGDIGWSFVGLFFCLSITTTIFVLGALVVLKRSKDLLHIENLERESNKMLNITKKFINGSANKLVSEKGIIGCLDDLNTEFNLVHKKLLRYALATQYVGENVVILNAPKDGEHILKSFFNNKDGLIEKHMCAIDFIRFTGTGRGAIKNGDRAYNFFEPLTDFLSKVFAKDAANLKGLKGVGSENPREQACFRAFMYRVIYFLLWEIKNNKNLKNFFITFIFPQHEVFPGQLSIGNVKSMFNVSLGAEDVEHVILKMPIALQVNSFGKNENEQEISILPKTVKRINEAFDCRFDDYEKNKEKWEFQEIQGSIQVTVSGINKDNFNKIINDIAENELEKTDKNKLLSFANCNGQIFNSTHKDDLGIIIESIAKVGYKGEIPDLYKKENLM